jgi:hypothetical protein
MAVVNKAIEVRALRDENRKLREGNWVGATSSTTSSAAVRRAGDLFDAHARGADARPVLLAERAGSARI